MLKIHEDWRRIVRHAWSVRLLAAAFALSFLEVALPLVQGIVPIPAGTFAALSGFATAGAFVSRLLAQKKFGSE